MMLAKGPCRARVQIRHLRSHEQPGSLAFCLSFFGD